MAVSNPFTPIRMATVTLLLFVCVAAQAQRDDWHMFSRDVFVKSVFAHGYMHGYEQGFHNGDVDLQMGRSYRDVKVQQEYKKPVGYLDQFGDRHLFDSGYRVGFLVGYTDCLAGRNFRAAQLLNPPHQAQYTRETVRFDPSFDRAFRDGYEIGQRQGLADGRISEVSRADSSNCQVQTGQNEKTADYCAAFHDGYQLGYSDGFANQRGTGEVLARNTNLR
jgi:flagellar biosynthesis/type III secretory pathway protein FliH